MPARRPVAIGSTFERLTVVSVAPSHERAPGHFTYRVNVRCQCGNCFIVDERSLRNGNTTSCGCKVTEYRASGVANLRHGLCYTRTYRIWQLMRRRCANPNTTGWDNYGGRGIKVCSRWQVFENFLSDMDECPEGMTIERIRNNGNYSPGNCRWATYAEQARNTRQNRFVIIDGRRMCITDAAAVLGINRCSIRERAQRQGISLQEATDYFAAKHVSS